MQGGQSNNTNLYQDWVRSNITGLNSLSIRARIILFTLVATLLPASSLGWIFYLNSQSVLEEKTTKEMVTGVSQIQNELDLWLKAKSYDLKVFSNSFIIKDNIRPLIQNRISGKSKSDIQDYFQLLLSQFSNYRQMMLFDTDGNLLVTSSKLEQSIQAPVEWQPEKYSDDHLIVSVVEGTDQFWVGAPIVSNSRQVQAWLAVEMDLEIIAKLLADNNSESGASINLVNEFGESIIYLDKYGEWMGETEFTQQHSQQYLNNKNQLIGTESKNNVDYLGAAASDQSTPWSVILLKPVSDIYAGIINLRNVSLMITLALIVLIGLISLLLSQSILQPLYRLKMAAAKVSEGNLDVSLSHLEKDELGEVMSVFNDMVGKLSESHKALELLSTTDELTNLNNRKRIMQIMSDALERYRRYGNTFSILMIDLDYFKNVNDQYGHLVGDFVLKEIGQLFTNLLRNIDSAARYGGEEFLIILDQSNETEARNTAERIRKEVDKHCFKIDELKLHCTLSIGITTVRNSNQTENILIREADDALYKAKNDGRNRSFLYADEPVSMPLKPSVKK